MTFKKPQKVKGTIEILRSFINLHIFIIIFCRKSSQISTRRQSDVPVRPLTMHSTQKRSIVHLYGRGKSRSVPSVMISTCNSLPKIQS